MKSKNYQLMLLAGALTVSFAARATEARDNTSVVKSVEENEKGTDANISMQSRANMYLMPSYM